MHCLRKRRLLWNDMNVRDMKPAKPKSTFALRNGFGKNGITVTGVKQGETNKGETT